MGDAIWKLAATGEQHVWSSLDELDALLESLPNVPAIFALHAAEGEPYLARTTQLQRRLKRLLAAREQPSRLLHLRSVVQKLELYFCGSRLEADLTLFALARSYFPTRYLRFVRLQMPYYVRLLLSNRFPRTTVTSRLTNQDLYYGPFRTKAAAEAFEHQMLGLFQMRRCEEDLAPTPDHPGCMYGEMNMCLRPCQAAVSDQEYASEAARVREFLSTEGRQLLLTTEAARDRLSSEMEFEEAARQHRRLEQIQGVLKQRDDLAHEVSQVNGVAVTRSSQPYEVVIWCFEAGCWQGRANLHIQQHAAESISLDKRLRDLMQSFTRQQVGVREQQEHLALLTRWFHSSWRDGEWIPYESRDRLSYRKLSSAVARVGAPKDGVPSNSTAM
ncbi:MAG TPA: hypothetical protein VE621_19930 [Bryobacteraceae bacterium]|nr:hypothetical protein [Bryobacteraceae bacterium]